MTGATAAQRSRYLFLRGKRFSASALTNFEFFILVETLTTPSLMLNAISDSALMMFRETVFKNFFASAFFNFTNFNRRTALRFKLADMLTSIYLLSVQYLSLWQVDKSLLRR